MDESTMSVDTPPTPPTPPGTQSQQQTVKQLVHKLEAKFLSLTDKARQAVNLSGISLSQFCMLLTQIPAAMKDDKITIRYFRDNIRLFNQSSSIDEIFYHLNLYWDFLNYGLLEHIVDRLENDEFKQEMEKYVHELTSFKRTTTLREFSCVWHHKSVKVPCDLRKLVTKHDKSWMDRTLEEVEQFREKFSVKFSLSKFSLILIQIEKGSVLITWWLPSAAIPLLEDQLQDPSYNVQQLWQEYEILGLMLDGHSFHPHSSSVVSLMNNQGIGDMHLFDQLWQHLISALQYLLPMLGPNFYSTLTHTSEEPRSTQATLQIVLLAFIWCAGVSEVVGRRSFRFTVLSILYCLLIWTLAGSSRRVTVRLLAPLVHCLGCLVGTVFGLYFNRLGINVASGGLLGIISAASVMQSISRLHWEDSAPLATFAMCIALIGLVYVSFAFKLLYRVLSHYGLLKWFYLGIVFTSMVSSLCSDDPEKFYLGFSFLGNIIGYIIASITYSTMGGNLVGATLGSIIGLFTGAMITGIANKDYPFAYFMSTVSVSITLFAAVGWYYFGFLTGTPIFAFMGYTFAISNVIDEEVVRSGQHEAGNMALYFACRLLGAGISSLTVLPLFRPFLDHLVGWLAKKIFSFGFVQSVWQYTANLGAQNDTVYGAFMWMKRNHVNFLSSFGLSLTMLIGIASGALLGGLCGHAMLMLIRSSDDERVAGWSLMVSGSVVGALSAYNMSGLKVGVPIGALVGCSITAAILLWRGGFHFKAYFKRNIQLSFGWEIFNMFKSRMERYV